jgi:methanogen homoisocitrate dehydrogenase
MKVAVLRGDGVGPEVVDATLSVLNAVANLEFIDADIGEGANKKHGSYLPAETMDTILQCDAILLGTVDDKTDDRNHRSPVLDLKKQLGLYANIRPFGLLCDDIGYPGINTIIIRENSEGMYTGAEIEDLDGVTLERRVSSKACKRICKTAIEMATVKERKKITCAHKAYVFKGSDGLFRDIFYEQVAGQPFAVDDIAADKLAAKYITDPESIDVVVTLNLYGDIISEEVSALVGGTYLTPSGNIGEHMGLFEPMHSAEDELAGKNVVNPTSCILAGALMLDFLNMRNKGDVVRNAVRSAYADNERTIDVGGSLGTKEFAEAVIRHCSE